MNQPLLSNCVQQVLVDNVLEQVFPDHFHFSTHLHRSIELMICLSGCVIIPILGEPHSISAGEYLVVFPDIPHSNDVRQGKSRVLQTHFHSQSFQPAWNPAMPMSDSAFSVELSLGNRKFFRGKSSPQLEACVRGLQAELGAQRDYESEMIRLYLAQMGLIFSRDLMAQSEQEGRRELYENPYLMEAVLYINEHFCDKLTVSEVAQAVGVSARYLTRLFQEHLNLGVSTYITYVRISKAIDFKHQNPPYPLTDLALDMGFGSQQHFSKVFKERMGVSPKKYFSIGTVVD